MKNGVTGNSAQAYVRWYQNERRKYGVSWAFTDFSDSNQRHEVSIEGQERIWSSPYLIVDFLPNLYYEQNTEHDTPYYNPIKMFDIVPAFEASHLLWRSYEIAGSKYSAQVLVPPGKNIMARMSSPNSATGNVLAGMT